MPRKEHRARTDAGASSRASSLARQYAEITGREPSSVQGWMDTGKQPARRSQPEPEPRGGRPERRPKRKPRPRRGLPKDGPLGKARGRRNKKRKKLLKKAARQEKKKLAGDTGGKRDPSKPLVKKFTPKNTGGRRKGNRGKPPVMNQPYAGSEDEKSAKGKPNVSAGIAGGTTRVRKGIGRKPPVSYTEPGAGKPSGKPPTRPPQKEPAKKARAGMYKKALKDGTLPTRRQRIKSKHMGEPGQRKPKPGKPLKPIRGGGAYPVLKPGRLPNKPTKFNPNKPSVYKRPGMPSKPPKGYKRPMKPIKDMVKGPPSPASKGPTKFVPRPTDPKPPKPVGTSKGVPKQVPNKPKKIAGGLAPGGGPSRPGMRPGKRPAMKGGGRPSPGAPPPGRRPPAAGGRPSPPPGRPAVMPKPGRVSRKPVTAGGRPSPMKPKRKMLMPRPPRM